MLASHYQGKRLNSPNDAVVKSDGSIWFTDPSYGIDSEYEGDASPSEIGACHVYRIDPHNGAVEAVATDFEKPNGLAFNADESLSSMSSIPASPTATICRATSACSMSARMAARCSGGKDFATCDVGLFDGIRLDVHGNVWSSAGDGVHCYAPDGTLLGKIRVPEVVANLCFRRPEAQPPVHLRHDVAVCDVREHARCGETVIVKSP